MLFRLYLTIAITVLCTSEKCIAQKTELRPGVSVVDFLKSQGEPSDKAHRKKLYDKRFTNAPYTGTAKQNTELLTRLVSENKEAKQLAEKSLKNAIALAKQERASTATVSDNFACLGWVPAKGFGVNGSYGFSTRIHVKDGKLKGKDFVVLVNSAAASHGTMKVGGKVRLFVDGVSKPFAEFGLQSPWFATIGDVRTVVRYGKKDTVVSLPSGKKIQAEITLNPTVTTTSGTVALWGCTRQITVTDGK